MSLSSLKNNSNYLKIEEGESVKVAFYGTIIKYFIKYPSRDRYTEWREGLSARYDAKVRNYSSVSNKLVTFSFGTGLKKQLVELCDKYGEDIKVEISKKGSGKMTEYFAKYAENLTDADKEELKSLYASEPIDVPAIQEGDRDEF